MPNPPYFATGDALTGGFFWIGLRIPNSQDNWIMGQFLAGMFNMTQFDAWVTAGETTTEEATSIFLDIFNNRIRLMPWDIGDIKFTGAPPTSATWLLCDGTAYADSVYPALFAAIGTTFNTGGEPPGYFSVPDMRGRAPVMTNNGSGRLPSWADAPGGFGGEYEHFLTVAELAVHNHTNEPHTHTLTPHAHGYLPALPNVTTIGPGAPEPTAIPGFSGTDLASDGIASAAVVGDDTGSGDPHNNVQPTMALACYILAAF